MDLSPAMLERARETTTRIARADLRALPFDAMSIDLVVCGLALGDIAEIELALTEIARVLRPGGARHLFGRASRRRGRRLVAHVRERRPAVGDRRLLAFGRSPSRRRAPRPDWRSRSGASPRWRDADNARSSSSARHP